MKKSFVFTAIILLLFSCKKETEFIESKTIHKLILVKNPPKNDSLVKNQLVDFLVKNPHRLIDGCLIEFYIYTSNTKYFLKNNEDSGGFSSEEIINYQDRDGIARFRINKCKNDSTKLVGELRFYNSRKYNFYKPDTIIYKCQ
ncbi:hypothetical protein [Chryseobacterium sp.]|jgi:hypothetical protein|uniref:hypothetical protein n=1 Tax=Chryseobacterium sp. TaxID=1871047 RepID=UPI0028454374|nr:hypothetical protein [Chryseobacterium sp.]MDR3025150.1 hypothetical protein [Chryseobacterium sp.]